MPPGSNLRTRRARLLATPLRVLIPGVPRGQTPRMPIYEYRCLDCDADFDLLVRGDATPACPHCESGRLERRLSTPAVHSEASRARGLKAARNRDSKLGKDRMHERIEYESSHD